MKTTRLAFSILACCIYFASHASSTVASLPPSNVSFYKVPLVCDAAPEIGCGSKAKPILKAIEKQKLVQEAWLNREGTLLAVVWMDNSPGTNALSSIKRVLTSYEIEPTEVSGAEREEINKTFEARTNWLRSTDVDKLSIEEAGVIATKIVAKLKEDGAVKPAFEEGYRKDVEKIFIDLFLSVNSIKELTTKKYRKIEKQIQKVGEKYVGEGNMPIYSLCPADSPACCEKSKSCEIADDKSCCDKN